MKALISLHEDEKQCLMKVYDEAQHLLKEFILGKCRCEAEKSVSEAVVKSKAEMEEKISEIVDKEVAEQSVLYQEQMRNTIRNLESNNKDRIDEMTNQCLKAMDVQNHLMVCRHLTEMMHMMTVEKQRWRRRMMDMKNEYESIVGKSHIASANSATESQDHQSKSIKYLWMEFGKQLDDVNVKALDESEQRIYNKIREFHGELVMEHTASLAIDKEATVSRLADVNSTHELNTVCKHQPGNRESPNFSEISAQWERIDNFEGETPRHGSFSMELLNRMPMDQSTVKRQSSAPRIASTIVKMVRTSNDEKDLEKNIAILLKDAKSVEISLVDALAPAVDVIPLPNIETMQIKDSVALMEKRVSYVALVYRFFPITFVKLFTDIAMTLWIIWITANFSSRLTHLTC